jgi:hypothetical protein
VSAAFLGDVFKLSHQGWRAVLGAALALGLVQILCRFFTPEAGFGKVWGGLSTLASLILAAGLGKGGQFTSPTFLEAMGADKLLEKRLGGDGTVQGALANQQEVLADKLAYTLAGALGDKGTVQGVLADMLGGDGTVMGLMGPAGNLQGALSPLAKMFGGITLVALSAGVGLEGLNSLTLPRAYTRGDSKTAPGKLTATGKAAIAKLVLAAAFACGSIYVSINCCWPHVSQLCT